MRVYAPNYCCDFAALVYVYHWVYCSNAIQRIVVLLSVLTIVKDVGA